MKEIKQEKKMKLTFLALFVLLFSVSGFAAITSSDLGDFDKLSDTQKAEVVKQIAQFSEASGGTSSAPLTADSVKETMKKWSEVGAGVGVLVVSAAKELGLAANEFAQTSLGKLLIVVGLVYMFGDQAVLLFAWFVCWFVFLPAVWRSYKKHTFKTVVETTTTDRVVLWLFPIKNTKVETTLEYMTENMIALHLIIAGVFFGSGVVALANL